MSETILCPACGHENPFGKKFCAECGAALQGAHWNTPAVESEGFVSGGVWQRPPTEFVRKVALDEMQRSMGRRAVTVPRGSVAVLMVDGAVSEVLPPGRQVAVGWWDRLQSLFNDKVARTELFLVDTRPLPVPFSVRARSQDGSALSEHQVIVELRVPREPGPLGQFLDRFARDGTASQRSIFDQLRNEVEPVVRPSLEKWTDGLGELAEAERALEASLRAGPLGGTGLEVSVRVVAVSSAVSLDLHLGDAPAPATKRCVVESCGAELESSKKFCSVCGAQQPIEALPPCHACGRQLEPGKKFCTGCGEPVRPRSAESHALFTKDGQQVELDVVLQVSGDRAQSAKDRVGPVVASAAAKHLRRFGFDEVSGGAGFAELEKAILADVHAALRSLGLRVVEVTVLDLRSKGGEWLLKGRSELEQTRNEVMLGREWLQVEGESLDLKVLSLDLALRNQRVERDHRFHQREDELADRRRQQALEDGHADLDVADAQRDAKRDIALDAAERTRDRAVAVEDHRDVLDATARAQEARVQADGFRRENEIAELGHEQALESSSADHEMAIERKVADHDAALSREAAQLGSEKNRLDADDRAYASRSGIDTDAYATRTRGLAEVDVARSRQDLELDAEAKRRAMRREDQQQQLEALARMNEMERAEQREKAEQERLAAKQQQEHEQAMRDKLRGLSTDQMLAMQASGEGGEAIAAALAEKFKADAAGGEAMNVLQKEMYERMLTEREASASKTADQQAAFQAQMMQMMQMMQAQSAQQMAVLGNVATAAVGGQKETEAARDAAMASGHASTVQMAEKAMVGMAQVASASAGGGGPPPRRREPAPEREERAAPAPSPKAPAEAARCGGCGAAMSAQDKFCGECGWRPSA